MVRRKTISLKEEIYKKLIDTRGDLSFSGYISKLLENQLNVGEKVQK